MKLYGSFELPLDINSAYEQMLLALKSEISPHPKLILKIKSEVGELLGSGTIIEVTQKFPPFFPLTYMIEVVQNERPYSFVQKSTSGPANVLYEITLESVGNKTLYRSCTTLTYKNKFLNLLIPSTAAQMIRDRKKLDTNVWAKILPNHKIKPIYSCTILGRSHHSVVWSTYVIIFVVSTIISFLANYHK